MWADLANNRHKGELIRVSYNRGTVVREGIIGSSFQRAYDPNITLHMDLFAEWTEADGFVPLSGYWDDVWLTPDDCQGRVVKSQEDGQVSFFVPSMDAVVTIWERWPTLKRQPAKLF